MAREKELVYIAGHRGLVGSAIVRAIGRRRDLDWVGRSRSELDLTNRPAVFDFVARVKPDIVIVAAAKVGGIAVNYAAPVQFLTENLQIQVNLLDAAHAAVVPRLLFMGSSCIYPKYVQQPIREASLLTGNLEPTNEAYAIAKIAGIHLVDAYRRQYQYHWISAIPANLFGLGDNFDLETSHVLPALIRRFHEVVESGGDAVTLWGTGDAVREFLYVDDLADASLFLLDNYDADGPINVGSGESISIRNLAGLIAGIVGFTGDILWDSSRPDGTPRRLLDSSRINDLGWHSSIDLVDGIERTYQWFRSHR